MGRPPPVEPTDRTAGASDDDLLDRLDPALVDWWQERFSPDADGVDGYFTPPQRRAIPEALDSENVLVAAPTGSGKTLASHTAVIHDLAQKSREGSLENTVYCLYISPLRSLANDIERNLSRPLAGVNDRLLRDDPDGTPIRHAIRHGDTTSADRNAMLDETPHILNTTPETLAILLNAPKFREKLRSVEYVIVDEIHSLADSKRGSHLAVSLERLHRLADGTPTRIGCSATIEPLDEVAHFLVGMNADGRLRPCTLVDCRFMREFDLELHVPVGDLIETPRGTVRDQLYTSLHDLIRSHTTTIVFTNTRSGAERVLHELRERYDRYDEDNSGCHHGSLAKGRRQAVERGLKDGDLAVVTTSTSLELGIDMPTVDMVVQLGSPKSVSALLQRVGRAGHRLGRPVGGRLLVVDRDELLECAVMVERALAGEIDRVEFPRAPLDVAVQHIYGMAINEIQPERQVRETLERAYPFASLSDAEWTSLLRYLTGEYAGLEERNVYAKIWVDENDEPGGEYHYPEYPPGERLIGKRGRLARPIYLMNVGTIPDSFSCDVLTRADNEWVGSLDEDYLDTLEPGEVFVLGGQRFTFRYRRGGKVFVDPTSEAPTVPSWYSERLPLARDVAVARLEWQAELVAALETDGRAGVRERLDPLPMNENARSAITRLLVQQLAYAGPEGVSTPSRLVIEQELDRTAYTRRYFVHACYGRRVNEGLSRLLARRCSDLTDANVTVAVSDAGFALAMPLNRKVDITRVLHEIDADAVREELREALAGTELLERYFRINATRSLLILKHYKGYEKSARERQVSSEMLLSYVDSLEDFAVLKETYRELMEDKFAVDAIRSVLADLDRGELSPSTVRVDSPSPLAFGLATLSSSDVVVASDESAVLRDYHRRVCAAIDDGEDSVTEPGNA